MTSRNPTVGCAVGGLAVALLCAAPAGAAQARRPMGAPAATATTPASAPVSLNLRDVPLRVALQTLFRSSGLQHAVESRVPNHPITMQIRGVPFRTALRTMLRLAPGVTYRKEGDVYIIGPRRPAAPVAVMPPPPPETMASAVATVEKIPLNYLHPAVAAAVLGGVLIPTEPPPPMFDGYGGSGGYGGGYGGGLSGGLGQQGFGGFQGGSGGGYGLNSGGGGFRGALNRGGTRSASQSYAGPRARRRRF